MIYLFCSKFYADYEFCVKHEKFSCIGVGILPESCYLLTFYKKIYFSYKRSFFCKELNKDFF